MNSQEIETLIEIIRPEYNKTLIPKQLLHILEAPMSRLEFKDILKQIIEFLDFSVKIPN